MCNPFGSAKISRSPGRPGNGTVDAVDSQHLLSLCSQHLLYVQEDLNTSPHRQCLVQLCGSSPCSVVGAAWGYEFHNDPSQPKAASLKINIRYVECQREIVKMNNVARVKLKTLLFFASRTSYDSVDLTPVPAAAGLSSEAWSSNRSKTSIWKCVEMCRIREYIKRTPNVCRCSYSG